MANALKKIEDDVTGHMLLCRDIVVLRMSRKFERRERLVLI